MEKLKKALILVVILVAFSITTSFAETGTVNTPAVRLREKANTSSEIITNIYEDEKVEILETLDEWYKVKYQGNTGYVKKEFLSTDSSSSETTNNSDNNSVNKSNNNVSTNQNNTIENEQNNSVDNDSNNNLDLNCVTNSDTNVRLIPSMMSTINMTLPAGKELTVQSQINNWVQVTDGTFSGWILLNKIVKDPVNPEPVQDDQQTQETEAESVSQETNTSNANKKGRVNVETANVRETAISTANIIGFLDYNDEVTIVSEEGDWYKITADNVSGYVSKRLIDISDENQVTSRGLIDERTHKDTTTVDENTNNNLTEALNSNKQNNGQDVVDYAKQFLNYPYVSGGKNPKTGFDCSGFTRYVFLNFGYTLGNTSSSQNSIGKEVTRENLQPGDLILFYDEGKNKIGHTGIYIGNAEFIHAANPSRGVVIDNINTNSYYNERFVTARRIIE